MNSEERMLHDIGIADFVLTDLMLYLDTHPTDRNAMEYFNHYTRIKTQMEREFSREYYPLRTKLQQGFYPTEIIEQAIAYVAGFHYIDDLRYAVDYITYHEDSRSRRRIEQDLQGKGIPAATMEEAWQVWREKGGEQDEQSMIRELLHKKHYDPEAETDWKERQKIYAFLVRKGFSAEAIRKAIGGMHSDDF